MPPADIPPPEPPTPEPQWQPPPHYLAILEPPPPPNTDVGPDDPNCPPVHAAWLNATRWGIRYAGNQRLWAAAHASYGEVWKSYALPAVRALKLAADTRVADWTLGAEWQAVSHRWDNAANTKRLGGYTLVNLYASTRIARQWDLLARIDNLGDKSYQLASGYATPPRTFFIGLRWTGR